MGQRFYRLLLSKQQKHPFIFSDHKKLKSLWFSVQQISWRRQQKTDFIFLFGCQNSMIP